jgi:hypothetical protein
MMPSSSDKVKQVLAWLTCDANRAKARALRAEIGTAFTAHPQATGESYFEHLCFTVKMAARFFFAMTVLMIHGLFPFLLVRAASSQIEIIYGIMKTRIPKARRDEIDLDYSV